MMLMPINYDSAWRPDHIIPPSMFASSTTFIPNAGSERYSCQASPHPWRTGAGHSAAPLIYLKVMGVPIMDVNLSIDASSSKSGATESAFVPKTALVKKLLEIRNRAISKGMKLLSSEEISEEIKLRRGGIEVHEANLS